MVYALIFVIVFVCTFSSAELNRNFIYPCYFCNYQSASANYTPEQYIPGLCTHIFYAFGIFNETTFEAISSDLHIDYSDHGGLGFYERVNNLKIHDKKLKTSLSFGGWGFSQETSKPFSKMSSTIANRKNFIDTAIKLVRKNGFDGIDIDWEFPNGTIEKDNFISLLKELYEATLVESRENNRERLLITAAVGQTRESIKNAYKIPEMVPYVDYVGVMTYEYHNSIVQNYTGFNSPLFPRKDDFKNDTKKNIAYAGKYWADHGMPKSKILIGFPTFANGWTLDDTNKTYVGAPGKAPHIGGSYPQICDMLSKGATRKFDDEAKVPYLIYKDQWFSFDDVDSYKIKLKWLKRQKYAGAFIWAMDSDDFLGRCNRTIRYPLQRTIAKELGGFDINKHKSIKTNKTPKISYRVV
uniref:GH18 domain-containing protein n=1 Tax=Acrobeloides nanus TaxID=290746 RepID=A0A914CV68_9BILA